jgi:hypothetical protein
MKYLGQVQDLSWASPSRIFATEAELFDSQPNFEHELAIAMDTGIKYQGVANVIGGWGFATGKPGPFTPPPPAPTNDQFTQVLLEFDGIEGSTTYQDTNAAGIPRTWTQRTGMGHITNVGEKFYSGALKLDGKTVITAPDSVVFDLSDQDFTFRGYFLCGFPLGEERVLAAKSNRQGTFVFWLKRTADGFFSAGIDAGTLTDVIVDRTGTSIVARDGSNVVARVAVASVRFGLLSKTVYSDTVNPGWHRFRFNRSVGIARLIMDNITEDTVNVGNAKVAPQVGALTIGGNGQPIQGMLDGLPWIGGFDRFGIDFGIAR